MRVFSLWIDWFSIKNFFVNSKLFSLEIVIVNWKSTHLLRILPYEIEINIGIMSSTGNIHYIEIEWYSITLSHFNDWNFFHTNSWNYLYINSWCISKIDKYVQHFFKLDYTKQIADRFLSWSPVGISKVVRDYNQNKHHLFVIKSGEIINSHICIYFLLVNTHSISCSRFTNHLNGYPFSMMLLWMAHFASTILFEKGAESKMQQIECVIFWRIGPQWKCSTFILYV